MVIVLALLAIFAEFFSPNPIGAQDLQNAFVPPHRIRFLDSDGNFHWRPFIHPLNLTLDNVTFEPIWEEDLTKIIPIRFFVQSWDYKLLGLIPSTYHFLGVDEGKIYLIGTNKQGRDMWGKAIQAGRISLTISMFGTLISVIVGSIVGVVSGYYGGWIDNAIQRFVEFVSSFPSLPLWMSLAAIVPRTWDSFSIFLIMSAIFALLSWTTLAREVRGKVLALRATDFVLAAKESGASDWRIMMVHLLPNSISHIIVILTLSVPGIILAEAFLSFLGIGIQEPLTSWGLLMRDAQNLQTLGANWWIMSPILFILTAVLGFNLLGDGLRDAADPYSIV
jgi:peptide/nickel transport system permease protein